MTLQLTDYKSLNLFYFLAVVRLIFSPHLIIPNTFLTLFINNLAKDNTEKKSSLMFYNYKIEGAIQMKLQFIKKCN